jgi:hypothetical protein
MPSLNIKKMDDSIDSKSKSLRSTNIWIDDIDNEINETCPIVFVTNRINIHYTKMRLSSLWVSLNFE